MIDQENIEYQHESQCQDYTDYGPQGYHPVELGEKFNQKYIVVQKLGWGHFSTVWLVKNQSTNQHFAMKVQRSKQSHAESAIDQLQILSEIRKHQNDENWHIFLKSLQQQHSALIKSKLCRPLLLFDNFPHYGIHGKHYCSVFQILGPNLLDLIQHYEFKQQRMPLWLVKKITIDTLLGLVFLHQNCNIIHTDLKPQNIMIKLQEHQQRQLIQQIKSYKVRPLSMKYLKNIQTSKNSKNKKKKLKKKKKKQGENGANQIEQGQDIKCEEKEDSQSLSMSLSKQDSISQKIIQEPQSKGQIVGDKIPLKQQNSKSSNQNSSNAQELQQSSQIIAQSSQSNNKEDKEKDKWNQIVLKWKNVKIDLNYNIFFKIVDMGNACFADKHFTQEIQTRQYRSPQVILGHPYEHNTDVWSLGCTVFELMTNNFLFKPKKIQSISKDEDHLYKMLQVLGPMSKQFAIGGSHSSQYFNKKGKLIHGNPKQELGICKLLMEDYDYDLVTAKEAQQFLMPLLQYQPKKRLSARDCLKHEWLWK